MKIKNAMCMLFIAILVGCNGKQISQTPVTPAPEPGEKLIWSSHSMRPGWTVGEPYMIEGDFAFVGLSGNQAIEKESREDALRTVIGNIIKYIGTSVVDEFQKIQTSYGLSKEIVNPTNAVRRLEEQISGGLASRVKPVEWYTEKWYKKTTSESYYVTFVLARIPKAEIDRAYNEVINETVEDLKNERDKATEQKAKEQFDNAIKAFEDLKVGGFKLAK
jgi:hypothetical protein